MIVPKYALKVYQSSSKSSYAFAYYNGFCKVYEKNNLSPLSPLNEEKKKKLSQLLKLIFPHCITQSCSHLECGVLKVEGACSIKMIPIQEGSTELCVHEICVL